MICKDLVCFSCDEGYFRPHPIIHSDWLLRQACSSFHLSYAVHFLMSRNEEKASTSD